MEDCFVFLLFEGSLELRLRWLFSHVREAATQVFNEVLGSIASAMGFLWFQEEARWADICEGCQTEVCGAEVSGYSPSQERGTYHQLEEVRMG